MVSVGAPVMVATGAVRATLFDADGHDSELDPSDIDLEVLGDRHLLWVDIDLDAEGPSTSRTRGSG
jgi:hypothetical protein